MPTELDEAQTGGIELLFADDLPGTEFQLRESAVYEAEEVREELDLDIPEFGKWIPVTVDGEDCWIPAYGEVVEELQVFENAMAPELKVTRCEKSGSKSTDPYEVNIETVDGDSQQTGL